MPLKQYGSRSAASLVELIFGILVSMVVLSLAVSHVVRYRENHDAVSAILGIRAQLRDGSDILLGDIRGSSPAGDSLLVVSDTAVEFYSAIGSSTVCASPAPNRIVLPPDTITGGRILSSWVATPEAGDELLVFGDSASSPMAWRRARITSFRSVVTAAACPPSAGLLSATEIAGSSRSYEVSVDPAVSLDVRRGAPVRMVRLVRYSIYRGGDGKWYLGYRRCSGGCAAVQPVSGPYQISAGPPMSFRYFTRTGAAFGGSGPTAEVARIEVVSRVASTRSVRLPGGVRETIRDSALTTVTLRNRW